MWARELVRHGEPVGLADTNPGRIAAFQRHVDAPGYDAADVPKMLAKEKVDLLLVSTVDATHDTYIVAGLEAGCDVITEKPMTVDVPRCERILDAQRRTGKRVTVAFNYRFHPIHQQIKQLLPQIGEIGSVHFEWLLDVRHGADYFRRWHRDKANSGGLLVHKATHHFDLVNWWLGASPEMVSAQGRLFFYGEQGARHGYARDYQRAHGSELARDDPFAVHLDQTPALKELYLEAEEHDGYHRDVNVFAPGVTIEDDLAVLVRYDSGATMSYHLTAYAPWEGYRIAGDGSKGRLELDMVESDHVAPGIAGMVKGHHGTEASPEGGSVSLRLRHFWQRPVDVPVAPYEREGHGGADSRMVSAIFSAEGAATALDGARSLLTGLAANESIATQRSVRAHDLLNLTEWER
jgi:predicted dehydrogenase